MSYRIVNDSNLINRQEWSDFVFSHPHGNIFQTPEIFDVYRTSKKHEPIIVCCYNIEDNKLNGLMLSVIQKEHRGWIGKFSSRSIIWGGPLVKDDSKNILDLILKEYNNIISKKAVYSQFRNLYDTKNLISIFELNKYKFEEHLNILIDLTKTNEQLWKETHSKRRNEIRKANKQNVNVVLINNIDIIEESYNILKEVYNCAKLPLYDKYFFLKAFNFLNEKQMIKVFGAFYNNKLIGTLWAFIYNGVIYDWFAGSFSEYYNKNPNDIIPWEVFKWGTQNGYKLFDFGGAGKPNIQYGVRDYKLKFGGDLVNFGRFENVHKPFLMIIGIFGLKLYKKINGIRYKLKI